MNHHRPVSYVDVGPKRIWVTAYNPSDALADAYCVAVANLAAERLAGIAVADVHAWLRRNAPEFAGVLDHVEAGGELPRETPAGEFPVTPGLERMHVPIITEIQRRNRDAGN